MVGGADAELVGRRSTLWTSNTSCIQISASLRLPVQLFRTLDKARRLVPTMPSPYAALDQFCLSDEDVLTCLSRMGVTTSSVWRALRAPSTFSTLARVRAACKTSTSGPGKESGLQFLHPDPRCLECDFRDWSMAWTHTRFVLFFDTPQRCFETCFGGAILWTESCHGRLENLGCTHIFGTSMNSSTPPPSQAHGRLTGCETAWAIGLTWVWGCGSTVTIHRAPRPASNLSGPSENVVTLEENAKTTQLLPRTSRDRLEPEWLHCQKNAVKGKLV